MKTCKKCNLQKPLSGFYKCLPNTDGVMSWCKECEAARKKAANAVNKEKRLVVAKKWRENNKQKLKEAVASWRERNPGRHEQIMQEWAKNNPGKLQARWARHELEKSNRTPSWLTSEMVEQIQIEYELSAWCTSVMGVKYHVDHIVPLRGRTVSGLHVPWNLQVIPAAHNQAKSNKFSALEAV